MRIFTGSICGLVLLGTAFSSSARAQSAGSEETIRPGGVFTQAIALTTAQKKSIYDAVFQQRVKSYTFELATTIGAVVPPSVELTDFPGDIVFADPQMTSLKYAMAGNNMVVVVNPAQRFVVDVIRGGKQP